jgi:hypothetical protein
MASIIISKEKILNSKHTNIQSRDSRSTSSALGSRISPIVTGYFNSTHELIPGSLTSVYYASYKNTKPYVKSIKCPCNFNY